MTLKEMTHALDEKLRGHILQYHQLHTDFDKYRGVTLDKEQAEKVEEIFNNIMTSMKEMIDCLQFIKIRQDVAIQELAFHEKFIQELEQAQLVKNKGKNENKV